MSFLCPPLAGKAVKLCFFYFIQNPVSEIRFGTGAQRPSFRHQIWHPMWGWLGDGPCGSPDLIGCSETFSTLASFKSVEGWRIPLEARSPGTLAWKGQAPVIPYPPSQQLELWGRSRWQKKDHPRSCRGHLCLEDVPFFLLLGPPWMSYSKELFWGTRKGAFGVLRHLDQCVVTPPACTLRSF